MPICYIIVHPCSILLSALEDRIPVMGFAPFDLGTHIVSGPLKRTHKPRWCSKSEFSCTIQSCASWQSSGIPPRCSLSERMSWKVVMRWSDTLLLSAQGLFPAFVPSLDADRFHQNSIPGSNLGDIEAGIVFSCPSLCWKLLFYAFLTHFYPQSAYCPGV